MHGRRLWKWGGERRAGRHDLRVETARGICVVVRHVRMAALGFLDDLQRKRRRVVGAEEPPGGSTVEGHVEKSFVTLALDQLGSRPLRINLLAGAAGRPPRPGRRFAKLAPRRG